MEGVDYLADERNKAEFSVDDMKIVWAGSRHALEISDRISRLVASDPVNFLPPPFLYKISRSRLLVVGNLFVLSFCLVWENLLFSSLSENI